MSGVKKGKTQVSPRKVLGLGILEEKNDENYPLGFTEFLFFEAVRIQKKFGFLEIQYGNL